MNILKEKMKEKRVSQTMMIDLLIEAGYTIDACRLSQIVNGHLKTPKARSITTACYKILEGM